MVARTHELEETSLSFWPVTSAHPADPRRVGIDTMVEDALGVVADQDLESCVVMGWSMGVNTAFALAAQHPSRVTGLLAVAGVPGDTFSSMLAPLRLPARSCGRSPAASHGHWRGPAG